MELEDFPDAELGVGVAGRLLRRYVDVLGRVPDPRQAWLRLALVQLQVEVAILRLLLDWYHGPCGVRSLMVDTGVGNGLARGRSVELRTVGRHHSVFVYDFDARCAEQQLDFGEVVVAQGIGVVHREPVVTLRRGRECQKRHLAEEDEATRLLQFHLLLLRGPDVAADDGRKDVRLHLPIQEVVGVLLLRVHLQKLVGEGE